ncbi:hypothetical protein KOW79_006479 [Hemibagrus wyckioides]|uniref:Uncharacterized protein n=1 Tax=Hemibagrus wyckioides TaxID=337641 RepID=A0A9D3P0E4_9TELE|nr:hypothetical protein KOW79_006479 [Hemibagrus wyckioides]
MASRPTPQSLDIQGAKAIPRRLPTSTAVPSPSFRPPQILSAAADPLPSMVPMISGSSFAFAPPLIMTSAAKRYPDWNAETIPLTRTPSPKRHHGSSSHRQRSSSRSRSQSPRRYRCTRSRSRSRSPHRKSHPHTGEGLAPHRVTAELAKKQSSSSSSMKSSSSRKRSSSPSSKRSESSKPSSSSAMKTSFFKASVCMEREEDAKALVSCKDLKLHGKIVEICMEKEARVELRVPEHEKKPIAKKKESKHGPSKLSQAAKGKVVPKTAQTTKAKDVFKMSAAAKSNHVPKMSQAYKVKEVPKSQMAKGKQNVKPNELAMLPERLLAVNNVPYKVGAITEIHNLVKRFGSYKQSLALNGRIIFEMDTTAIARSVYSQFRKFPCIIQNHSLTFSLARMPRVADQIKKKPDAKRFKQPAKNRSTNAV